MPNPPVATVRVIDSEAASVALDIIEGGGSAKVVLWPGNGALHRTFQIIELEPGSTTRELSHASDCVYYVIEGQGSVVDAAQSSESPLIEGSMIHIDRGDRYRLRALGASGLRLLGGPCPPDPALYAHIQPAGG